MDFELSSAQKLVRGSIIEFVQKECPDELFEKMDEEEYYPDNLYKKLADLGFIGMPIPEEYGGSGMGWIESTIFNEETSKRLLALQMVFQVSVLAAGLAIADLGTEKQKETFLPPLAAADINFCIAYTEPDAGSDAASITAAAVPHGDGFLLSGQKTFITAADISDYMIVSTRTNDSVAKREGITAFIVDSKSEKIEINKIKKLGVKACPYSDVFFDGVYVPSENILNGLNRGWQVVTHSLEMDRVGAAARWVGIMQEALEYGLKYAKNRVQFDRPIGKYQLIREIFADLQTEIDAARLLTYRAALLMDQGKPCRKEASMAKLYASELVIKVTRNIMQIMGGYGYSMEYYAQRYLRDCLFGTVGAGTSQIQKLIIARDMGL
jgi:alkylation response protein AidB-like acyl-CoA dehydrogenase